MTQEKREKVKAAGLASLRPRLEHDTSKVQTDSVGIRNVLEIIWFAIALACAIIEAARDGISPLDVLDVLRDPEVRETFPPAVEEVGRVPLEVADLSPPEVFKIGREVFAGVEEVVNTVLGRTA